MADKQWRGTVSGRDGWSGTVVQGSTKGGDDRAEVVLDSGERLLIPAKLLTAKEDGSYYVPLSRSELSLDASAETVTIPLAAETLEVGKRVVEKGQVVVHIAPQVRTEVIDVPLAEERVDVERVPINRIVEAPAPAREEGNVTIIPIYDEILVVERRLRLKEEIRLTRTKTVRQERQEIPLRSEEARVLRSDAPVETEKSGS